MGATTIDLADRLEGARDRMRGEQLSFNVGQAGGKPDFASVKIGGDFAIGKDLKRRTQVVVTVALDDGTVLCQGRRTVSSIQFKDTEDKHGDVTTERIHTVS